MRQNDVLGKLGDGLLSQPKVTRPHLPLPVLVVAMLLVLTTLACALVEPGSQRIVIQTNLPTLTPTQSVTIAAESIALTPTPTHGVIVAMETPATPTPPLADLPDNPVVIPGAATTIPTLPPDFTATPMALPASEEDFEATDTPIVNPTAMPTTALIVPTTSGSTISPTPIVIPTITPIPETPGWSFAKVRTYSDQLQDGLLLYGMLINETGASQKLLLVTGNFFDGQGQKIAGQDNTVEFWPVEIVPAGGQVPFELAVDNLQAAADYKLWVYSERTDQTPRQEFDFAAVEQWQEEELYCLTGTLQNPGDQPGSYLVIVAILYDDQGNVVNFGEDYRSEPSEMADEGSVGFEICIDPPNQNVARYELKAWGE